ncbi:hypothetical protein [Xanthobacter sp. KR7-225]|uniref:hypothetical protein n=1 Tax=Xanthobacter sp. KR7-225 TaxID=3156613 RepID=UPI0032B4DACB
MPNITILAGSELEILEDGVTVRLTMLTADSDAADRLFDILKAGLESGDLHLRPGKPSSVEMTGRVQ